MGIVCPHYTHTDRTVGSYTTHVCRDCMARVEGCEHLAPVAPPAGPEPSPAPKRSRKKA